MLIFLLAFDEEVDCPVTSPLREQPVIRPNIPSILFVSYHTQQLNGILNMEYVQWTLTCTCRKDAIYKGHNRKMSLTSLIIYKGEVQWSFIFSQCKINLFKGQCSVPMCQISHSTVKWYGKLTFISLTCEQ